MSSIRLSDLDWTCVQQQIDAIRTSQAQTAREQGRELVTAKTMEWRAALQVVADGQPRQPTRTRDQGVAAGELEDLTEQEAAPVSLGDLMTLIAEERQARLEETRQMERRLDDFQAMLVAMHGDRGARTARRRRRWRRKARRPEPARARRWWELAIARHRRWRGKGGRRASRGRRATTSLSSTQNLGLLPGITLLY
ncbi:unnamed protein product [Linum trigynum]|uniref:Uncharacterized protein n=1 Tax=Linum trigynum TaxID=586398 RepID=A0AAV2CEV6_9ROSI